MKTPTTNLKFGYGMKKKKSLNRLEKKTKINAMLQVQKPIRRNKVRQLVGKEFYILKRKLKWNFGKTRWTKTKSGFPSNHLVFKHRSLILRPLAGIDMKLQHNKRHNLSLAIDKINQITIHPGETFSFWKLVGRPTKEKGYLDGLVLKNGTAQKGTGGGLCQLGNLLFWIFAHSPLTIIERYRHGYDVFPDINRKIPFGAGATLSYNYIDLQVKNNTSKSFQLKLWLDETHLNGSLFSEFPMNKTYLVEERSHSIKQQIWGGYTRHNEIFQIITNGEEKTEAKLVENHAIMMYNPFIE